MDPFNLPVEKTITVEMDDTLRDKITETESHGDSDLNRDSEERRLDKRIGDAGELLFKKAMNEIEGITATFNDGFEYDLDVNGYKVDIKTRKGWRPYNDLLVRRKTELYSDFYVQVIVHKQGGKFTHGEITGFTTKSEAEKAPSFLQERSNHDKGIIEHEDLHPMTEFYIMVANTD